jgi:hypothetical protein
MMGHGRGGLRSQSCYGVQQEQDASERASRLDKDRHLDARKLLSQWHVFHCLPAQLLWQGIAAAGCGRLAAAMVVLLPKCTEAGAGTAAQ